MSNPMRHDQHITHPMTYPMTDPQMKTKTMNMTMDKTRVQNCDVRAVSHTCDVLFLILALAWLVLKGLSWLGIHFTNLNRLNQQGIMGHIMTV